MADLSHDDLVEQILVRSDVKDLIRFKSVCKSWHSLITSPRFINRHLNQSYNKDRYDNDLGHRRIRIVDGHHLHHHLVGSCNGLVCLISDHSYKFLVGNPLTGEVRQLRLPPWIGSSLLCWGFGYDSSIDDYTVIVNDQTCVQVLSLKSNAWRVIGDVKYVFISRDGLLCNGALHWIVKDQNKKKLIIAYDLCKEEFKEIPLPGDARYECTSIIHLRIIKECLCVSLQGFSVVYVWLLKDYNVEQSWELQRYNRDKKYDIIHNFRKPMDDRILPDSFFNADEQWLHWPLVDYDLPVFVQSLVSPHDNVRLMRDKRSAEVDHIDRNRVGMQMVCVFRF